jgi:hypothetical protein
MTEQQLFIVADKALMRVVDQIKDDQWELMVEPPVARKPDNLRKIINYHAYDEAWVPDVLAGKTIEEVGNKYDGDLLGDDPKGNFRQYADKAIAAVEQFDDLDKSVHLSYGEYPAREYLWHITSFRATRAVTLARLIRVDDKIPTELAEGLYDLFLPVADEWRKIGVFGPEIKVSTDASAQEKFLGLVGIETKA